MSQERFEKKHRDEWLAFSNLLDAIEKRTRAFAPGELESFPHGYRRLCKQLALARDRQYSTHLVDELNAMVLRAHRHLYKPRGGTFTAMARFFSRDFPRAVRREWRLFWLSTLLFYGPLLGVAL